MESTLVLVKPDGMQKHVIGAVIDKFERSGLKIIALKMLIASKEQVDKHYILEKSWYEDVWAKTKKAYDEKGLPMDYTPIELGAKIRDQLVDYLAGKPIVAMVVEGNNAVASVRKIVGATSPNRADPGTIRKDYSDDSYEKADKEGRAVRNIVHASDGDNAEREIAVWFSNDEILPR